MATYLSCVNAVLAKLRESSVATVSSTAYSALIGRMVNECKRQVEDAWNWDALQTVIPVVTAGGTSQYTVTGSGRRHKDVVINDTTNQLQLHNVPAQWITNQNQLTTVQTGHPSYYAWDGFDGTDSKISLWPTPNGVFTLQVNLFVPQADLSADSDVITVPDEPVILGAYARAIVERGEDGGQSSSEAYMLFKSCLADYIAIEATRQVENDAWVAC